MLAACIRLATLIVAVAFAPGGQETVPGLGAGQPTVEIPCSKLKLEISRILTEQGYELFANFLKQSGGTR